MHERQFVSLRVNPPKRKFGNSLLSFVGTEKKWYKLHAIGTFFFYFPSFVSIFHWMMEQVTFFMHNTTWQMYPKLHMHIRDEGNHPYARLETIFPLHLRFTMQWDGCGYSLFLHLFIYLFYLELFPRLIFSWKGSTLASFTLWVKFSNLYDIDRWM